MANKPSSGIDYDQFQPIGLDNAPQNPQAQYPQYQPAQQPMSQVPLQQQPQYPQQPLYPQQVQYQQQPPQNYAQQYAPQQPQQNYDQQYQGGQQSVNPNQLLPINQKEQYMQNYQNSGGQDTNAIQHSSPITGGGSHMQQQYQQQQPNAQQLIQQNYQNHPTQGPAPMNYGQQQQQNQGLDYNQFRKEMNQQYNNQDANNQSLNDQARLRDRIGYFNKNVDNALVNAPDPVSSHFQGKGDRFVRDFAAVEKARREDQNKRKQEVVDSRRVQKYERDLKRWEFMEEENERQNNKINLMKDKYQIGNANKGGAAFNIINLDYEITKEGEYLKQRDDAANVRNKLRSKHIDTLGNAQYNLVNGENRMQVQIPDHPHYNPTPTHSNANAPGSRGSQLSKVGASIFGDGHAGRPLRGMDKQYGKRVASDHGALSQNIGIPQQNNINGNYQQPYSNNNLYGQAAPAMDYSQSVPSLPMSQANQYLQNAQNPAMQMNYKAPQAGYNNGGAGTKFY